jgi:predicted nucleic acid-binding protein
MKALLFDASSLIYSLKAKNLNPLYDGYIQWLTIYEAMNALWKEALAKALSIEEALEILSVFSGLIDLMKVINPHGCEREIVENAWKLGLTAYDASYVVLAKRHDLILVSEDEVLRKKADGIVETTSLRELV